MASPHKHCWFTEQHRCMSPHSACTLTKRSPFRRIKKQLIDSLLKSAQFQAHPLFAQSSSSTVTRICCQAQNGPKHRSTGHLDKQRRMGRFSALSGFSRHLPVGLANQPGHCHSHDSIYHPMKRSLGAEKAQQQTHRMPDKFPFYQLRSLLKFKGRKLRKEPFDSPKKFRPIFCRLICFLHTNHQTKVKCIFLPMCNFHAYAAHYFSVIILT